MNSLFVKIDDLCNAILVKELRQSVRGKFLWFILNALLLILACTYFCVMVDGISSSSGIDLAQYLTTCLLFCCFFLIPLNIGKKMAKERFDGTNELLFTTIMTPKQIILGKFLCGLTENTMLLCMLAPFILLSVYLGGFNIKNLLTALFVGYVSSLSGIMLQILFGLVTKKVSAVNFIIKAFGIILQFSFWLTVNMACCGIIRGREPIFHLTDQSLQGLFIFLSIVVLSWMFLYRYSVSILEPESSNKKYILRVFASLASVVIAILGIAIANFGYASVIVIGCMFIGITLSIYSEPDDYSQRLKKEIPNSFVEKLTNFPFFTGMANGLTWVIGFSVMSLFYLYLLENNSFLNLNKDLSEIIVAYVVIGLTITNYGLLGNYIRRKFFSSMPKSSNFGISILLFLFLGVISLNISEIIFVGFSPMGEYIYVVNPIGYLFRNEFDVALFWVSMGFLFVSMLNSDSIFRQIKSFFNSKKDDEIIRIMNEEIDKLGNDVK